MPKLLRGVDMGYARKRVTEELYAAAGKLLDTTIENGFEQCPWRKLTGAEGFMQTNLWFKFCSERNRLRELVVVPEDDKLAFLQLAQAVDEEYAKWIEDGRVAYIVEIKPKS